MEQKPDPREEEDHRNTMLFGCAVLIILILLCGGLVFVLYGMSEAVRDLNRVFGRH